MLMIDGPIAYVDIDDTLILEDNLKNRNVHGLESTFIIINGENFIANRNLITHLINLRIEGGVYLIAWSQAGAGYARDVINLLGISQYFSGCLAKPRRYYDDMSANRFMGQHIYPDLTKPDQAVTPEEYFSKNLK